MEIKMETVKVHCNNCGGERNHELLHSEKEEWEELIDGQFSVDGWDKYDLVKCCGCESISLRHVSYFSEDCDGDGNRCATARYYPPATSRKEPSWISKLRANNNAIHEILREVYICLHNNCPRLAIMGIRALIEHVMIEKAGDNGTFKANIDKFETSGFISRVQREVLDPVLEAGHATIHRAFAPSTEDLNSIIDIVENIIESIYINEGRAKSFREKVPRRVLKGK
jgi:hypothetical protein